jgi:transcriptional regulator with XRE-family HTH domain
MTGSELAAARNKCGLTQTQLASYLGIGRTSVWRCETGHEPVSKSIEGLASGLYPGSASLEGWLLRLDKKNRHEIWRRQHKYKFNKVAGKRAS